MTTSPPQAAGSCEGVFSVRAGRAVGSQHLTFQVRSSSLVEHAQAAQVTLVMATCHLLLFLFHTLPLSSCSPQAQGWGWGVPSTPSWEAARPEGSHNNGVCTALLFQMYIALISLHALIMVGFHFLHCFEEDWTSEYAPGRPRWSGGVTRAGRALCFRHGARSHLILLDFLQGFGVTGEGSAEVQVPPQDKKQPLKVRATGNAGSWTEPLA